ncbi:MAG: hypothetical protein J6Q94_01320 [Clostridia bacterium]|nr:hypothetical protein [Clostridia bacterium]
MDINEILSSLTPDDIAQLKSVASSLMGTDQNESKKEQSQPDIFSPEMLGNLGKIGNAVSGDDHRTALLKALRPMLSEERQKKADEAIKILRIIRLIPLLRESGLLSGLL